MEIHLDKTDNTSGVIHIKINKKDFQPQVDKKIKNHASTAQIKGFRAGKVPLGMMKKMYGDAVTSEEVNKVVTETLNKYISESDVHFLGEPHAIAPDSNFEWSQENFNFDFNVGFATPFTLKIDEKFKVERKTVVVDSEVIDETIGTIRNNAAETETVEVIAEGDILYGNFVSKDKEINVEVRIDLNELKKTSAKKLVGHKKDDSVPFNPSKEFNKEYVIKHIFKVETLTKQLKSEGELNLKAIERPKLPEMRQDFFDKVLGKDSVKTLGEFKEKIEESTKDTYKNQTEMLLNETIQKKIIQDTKIELPEEFLKQWFTKEVEHLEKDAFEKELDIVKNETKWSLILNEFCKQNNINVDQKDVIEHIKKGMQSYYGNQLNDQQVNEMTMNYLQGEDGKNFTKTYNSLRNETALKKMKDLINITEKKITLDEFRTL